MPARIRLRRMGRKKTPHYRIVVADSRAPRDGRFVETLGYYKPLSQPARLVLDLERVDHWIGEGASPSGTVKSLISRARKGGDPTVAVGEQDAEERKAKRAEELASRRAAEKKKEAEAKAAQEEAAKQADAEEKATAEAEAEAAVEGEADAADEPAVADEPEAAAADTGDAEESDAPAAEAADEAPEAAAGEDEEKSE
ncbi:MAG: 30S ribosomal protein S16 [Gemmatimonadota bacterium]|nr:30S ribosomal protein S16 [Gemmatimonadota bacterium]